MIVTVKVEVDENVRERAEKNLAARGLTVAEAFRLMLARTAADQDDIGPLIPNRETVAAIEAARRGELVSLGSPTEAMAELNTPL